MSTLDEAATEIQIQAKGNSAPRLTPEAIDSVIANHEYHVFGGVMTVCCITLNNGFMTIGKSACASPENFDAEIGRKLAYNQARDKIWELEGYLLRDKLDKKQLVW